MNDLVKSLDEKWYSIGEYYLTTVPPNLRVTKMQVTQNPIKGPKDPSYFFEADLLCSETNAKYSVKISALKLKRDLEQVWA